MGLIYVVRSYSDIQDRTIGKTEHYESPIAISQNLLMLVTLIKHWDETNCLVTHSNQNSLSPMENYIELTKAFTANDRIVISEDDDYKVEFGHSLMFVAEKAEKLKELYQSLEPNSPNVMDIQQVTDILHELYQFFTGNMLNDEMIQSTEINSSFFIEAQDFFKNKMAENAQWNDEWLEELDQRLHPMSL